MFEDQQGVFKSPKLDLDNQGFIKSFDIQSFDPLEVKAFYDKYNIVIFNNVINQEDIEKTIDQLCDDIRTRSGPLFDLKDKNTWKFDNWKGRYGFVNNQPLKTIQISLNRQNKNVYKCFKTLYELTLEKQLKEPLLALFDRGSGIRPGKNNPQWIISDIYHFDINPWAWTKTIKTEKKEWRNANDYAPQKFAKWLSEGNKLPYNGFQKISGVLALTDTNDISGGFQCVCGFSHYIKQWCEQRQPNSTITSDQNLMKNFQKIYQRKGSLLLFNRQLPHNIYKNLSQEWRFAQYLRMAPESSLILTEFQKEKRRKCVLNMLPKNLPIQDEISQQIYMLK